MYVGANPRRAAGVTLIELIVAIVIIAVGITGVLSVFVTTISRSADPMLQQQAQLLAEAYLEEILLKKFFDPETGTVCTLTAAGETRITFDNVCDYHNLNNNPPRNQFDLQFPNLDAAYTVGVQVDSAAGVALGALNTAGGVMRVLRVDVTVNGPNNIVSRLSGYKVNYNCQTGLEPGCAPL